MAHHPGLNPIVDGTKISGAWMEYVEDSIDTWAASSFKAPTSYIVYASAGIYSAYADGVLIYGGASNAGGVDGTSPAAVVNACLVAMPDGGTIVIRRGSYDAASTKVSYTASHQEIFMEPGTIWTYTGANYAFDMDIGASIVHCKLVASTIDLNSVDPLGAIRLDRALYSTVDIGHILGTATAPDVYTTGQNGIVLDGTDYTYLNDITLRQFMTLDTAILVGLDAVNYNANANTIYATGENGGDANYVCKFYGGVNRFHFRISMAGLLHGLLFDNIGCVANTGYIYFEAGAAIPAYEFTNAPINNYIECQNMNGLLPLHATYGNNTVYLSSINQMRGNNMTFYNGCLPSISGGAAAGDFALDDAYLVSPANIASTGYVADCDKAMIVKVGGSNYYIPLFTAAGGVFVSEGTNTGTGAEQTIAHGLQTAVPAGLVPTRVWLTEYDTGGADAYQSTPADGTNIYVTATLNKTYQWRAEYQIFKS